MQTGHNTICDTECCRAASLSIKQQIIFMINQSFPNKKEMFVHFRTSADPENKYQLVSSFLYITIHCKKNKNKTVSRSILD